MKNMNFPISASVLLKIRPWDAKFTLLEAKVSFINFLRFWLILFMFILVLEFLCFLTLNLCLLPRSANGRWPRIQSCRVDKYFKIQVGNLKIKSFYKVSHWILWVFKCYFRKFKTKCTFLDDKRKTNPGYPLVHDFEWWRNLWKDEWKLIWSSSENTRSPWLVFSPLMYWAEHNTNPDHYQIMGKTSLFLELHFSGDLIIGLQIRCIGAPAHSAHEASKSLSLQQEVKIYWKIRTTCGQLGYSAVPLLSKFENEVG